MGEALLRETGLGRKLLLSSQLPSSGSGPETNSSSIFRVLRHRNDASTGWEVVGGTARAHDNHFSCKKDVFIVFDYERKVMGDVFGGPPFAVSFW